MDKSDAKRILSSSISNLHSRRGQLTNADLETEVINNACLVFLKNQKNATKDANSIEDMFKGILDSTLDIMPTAKAFTDAACELFPDYYSEKEAVSALMGIQQNVAWEGMWDFLRDYFEANHGRKIDNIETNATIFYSNKHQRFENGIMASESEVERTININFIEENEVVVGIAPSLSPKKAYLTSKNGNTKQFKGYDPDYLFTIAFDEFEEVDKFILEMPNRNLRIEYFE